MSFIPNPPPAPIPSSSASASDTQSTRLPLPTPASRTKPKQTAPTKKVRAPRPTKNVPPPATVRMTRSASLRQKKVEEEAILKPNPPQATTATPSRSRSMSLSSYAQPTAASAAKASPLKPSSSRPSAGAPSTSAFTFTPAATPRLSHARPSAPPSRLPTSASTTPADPPNAHARTQKAETTAGTAAGNSRSQLQLNSSLSTLSQALERLNAPPPSRPNTSLGFHPDHPTARDANGATEASLSKPNAAMHARPENASFAPAPGPSAGKGKASLVPPTPRTASGSMLKPSKGRAARQQPPEKKPLRQTTLVLTPRVPVPDKARAVARESSATGPHQERVLSTAASGPAVSGGGSNVAAEQPDTTDEQVHRAMAPSLDNVRNRSGLGFSFAPSGSGTPASTAGPLPGASARTSLAAAVNKRIFPAASSSSGRALFGGIGVTPGASVARLSATSAGLRGRGVAPWRGVGGRVLQRASKKSSLPVVQGSPVKGGAGVSAHGFGEWMEEPAMVPGNKAPIDARPEIATEREDGGDDEREQTSQDRIGEWLRNASEDVRRDLGHVNGPDGQGEDQRRVHGPPDPRASLAGPSSSSPLDPGGAGGAARGNEEAGQLANAPADKGKEREREKDWRMNASRRASLASQLLSQSLSAVPDTPSPMGVDAKAMGKLRAASSSWPVPRHAPPNMQADETGEDGQSRLDDPSKEMPPPSAPPPRPRIHNTRLATGALSTPPNAGSSRSLGASDHGGSGGDKGKSNERAKDGPGESPGALVVLRGCTIFVDVRTEEGDDAGALFVDMLRGLGAKIATRVGSKCTHVVYKNGLMSTLTRYRLLKDPKPLVVGIAWVVECAEQRTRVDENRFLVNLDMANVAGINRRRRSMLPKLLSSPGMDTKAGGAASPASSDSSFRTTATTVPSRVDGAARFGQMSAGDQSVYTQSREFSLTFQPSLVPVA
ncbi:hypothetical protein BD414DRAFT_498873 [Trametes punicea]|nr:hypothetical protein BD414DRAFT_498873 [Trametes punicea]